MPPRKVEFKCECGHKETEHNFDPYSQFFGCMVSVTVVQVSHTGLIEGVEQCCPCREFVSDNLRDLEESSELSNDLRGRRKSNPRKRLLS